VAAPGDGGGQLRVSCTVGTEGRTGVEMEALVGVNTAALCLYDMCKAASHEIRIDGVRLTAKSGGKTTVVDGTRVAPPHPQ